jgi:prophage antirepressor-like protein
MADIRTQGANALTFSFSTQTLRVVMIDGEPWFVAADVCAALGIKRTSDAVEKLDADEKGTDSIRTLGGAQEMLIVNESGLNAIILRCRDAMTHGTPAHKYRKWVTSEVLPAIRKTGRYEAKPQPRHAAREQLNAADMQNLKRLIWLVADRMRNKEVWSQAIWFYLRAALNHPAPSPFYVDQLPELQRELAQILNTAVQVSSIIRRIEQDAARRIFRRGEMADSVLTALDLGAQHDLAQLKSSLVADFSWIEQDLLNLTQRRPTYMGVDYLATEQPDFFLSAA